MFGAGGFGYFLTDVRYSSTAFVVGPESQANKGVLVPELTTRLGGSAAWRRSLPVKLVAIRERYSGGRARAEQLTGWGKLRQKRGRAATSAPEPPQIEKRPQVSGAIRAREMRGRAAMRSSRGASVASKPLKTKRGPFELGRCILGSIAVMATIAGVAGIASARSIAPKGISGDTRIGDQALTHPLKYQPQRSENAKGRYISQPKVPEPIQRELISPRAPIPDPSPQLIRRGSIPIGGNGTGGPKIKIGTDQYGTRAYFQPRPITLSPPINPNYRRRETIPNPSVSRPTSLALHTSSTNTMPPGGTPVSEDAVRRAWWTRTRQGP